nr:ribonuclease H-like domain, reverse transcriptase, RNA-dependent DNA polymerase [Tanacetum cinerariifolium]
SHSRVSTLAGCDNDRTESQGIGASVNTSVATTNNTENGEDTNMYKIEDDRTGSDGELNIDFGFRFLMDRLESGSGANEKQRVFAYDSAMENDRVFEGITSILNLDDSVKDRNNNGNGMDVGNVEKCETPITTIAPNIRLVLIIVHDPPPTDNSDPTHSEPTSSSYPRAIFKLWANVELKDTIVVTMPKLIRERDSNEKKLIQMIKIHTDKNIADLLTKAFDVSKFQYPIASINLLLPVMVNAVEDEKKIIVNEASIRHDLKLEDAEGTACLPSATIFEELTRMGAKTTAWNEFSNTMASTIICLATNQKFNFSKYIFDSMVKNVENMSVNAARVTEVDTARMDNPNITMEVYIRLEEEKARKHGKVFNWETAKYGKIWYDEDIHAIAFDGEVSFETLSCEPIVSSLNDEIDFRVSFDGFDDKEYTRYQYLRYEGLQYAEADIAAFESRLARIYMREVHKVQVFDFGGLSDLMAEGLSVRMLMEHKVSQGQSVFTSQSWRRLFDIRGSLDPILRLYHRLIACNIAGRSQAPEKETVTELFYLRGMDVDSVNVPYLLTRYLRLFTVGRKSEAYISGGQLVARLAKHFRLLTAKILQGLMLDDTRAWVAMGPERQPDAAAGAPGVAQDAPVIDEDGQADPEPVQAPPPPPAAKTMSQRMARLEEDIHRLAACVTYTSYSETPREYQRRVRRRTDGASTSAAQRDSQQPDP